MPGTLTLEQMPAIIDARERLRDRFFFALLGGSGTRVGQALGLRHEDIVPWSGGSRSGRAMVRTGRHGRTAARRATSRSPAGNAPRGTVGAADRPKAGRRSRRAPVR
jgi:integrase